MNGDGPELSSVRGLGCCPFVLVVDDERRIADTLSLILASKGYASQAAYDGTNALAVCGERVPDLLLTDVVMPEMNGIELAIAVRRQFPNCKVLLFSGQAATADMAIAEKLSLELAIGTISTSAKRKSIQGGKIRISIGHGRSAMGPTGVAEFKSKVEFGAWQYRMGNRVRILNVATTKRWSLLTGFLGDNKTYTVTYELIEQVPQQVPQQVPRSDTYIFCCKCGFQAESVARFCRRCGSPF